MVFSIHKHTILLGILALALVVIISMTFGRRNGKVTSSALQSDSSKSTSESLPSSAVTAAESSSASSSTNEMRAVWVPYMTLDMSRESDKSEQAFQQKFDKIVETAKQNGMNTLVVHVRPFADSLYPSAYFPWSHLTGSTQGVDPGYDPLAYMVQKTHEEGLKFHAWLNPLRIQVNQTPSILSEQNPYNLYRSKEETADYVVDWENGKYFNPAYPAVRKLIADGAAEIAHNYPVDGIQFDDYFYPTDKEEFDQKAYQSYCSGQSEGSRLSLLDWRAANINAMMTEVYQAIKNVSAQTAFGVSPQVNLENDRKMGADVAAWGQTKGYVDYICPQVYVNFNHPILPYENAIETWRNLVTEPQVKLYFGLGLYKADSNADSGAWENSTDVMARQVEAGRAAKCDGFMFYAYDDFLAQEKQQEVENVVKLFQ